MGFHITLGTFKKRPRKPRDIERQFDLCLS
jgi:hypothetical protein